MQVNDFHLVPLSKWGLNGKILFPFFTVFVLTISNRRFIRKPICDIPWWITCSASLS